MTTTTAFIVLCGALLVNGAFLKRPHLDGRITGGADADIKDLPYQVSIRNNGNEFVLCGGSIISNEWVMTSARCANKASSMMIRAGSNSFSSGGSLHQPVEVIIHEAFENDEEYDFAVVRVDPPFTFGPGVQPIGLADVAPTGGEESVISGWGQDDGSSGQFKEHLQVAYVFVANYGTCGNISNLMLCSHVTEDGKDTCWGDNGGPLVMDGKLIGIISYDGCGDPRDPSLYSNIANQREWIREKTGV